MFGLGTLGIRLVRARKHQLPVLLQSDVSPPGMNYISLIYLPSWGVAPLFGFSVPGFTLFLPAHFQGNAPQTLFFQSFDIDVIIISEEASTYKKEPLLPGLLNQICDFLRKRRGHFMCLKWLKGARPFSGNLLLTGLDPDLERMEGKENEPTEGQFRRHCKTPAGEELGCAKCARNCPRNYCRRCYY